MKRLGIDTVLHGLHTVPHRGSPPWARVRAPSST